MRMPSGKTHTPSGVPETEATMVKIDADTRKSERTAFRQTNTGNPARMDDGPRANRERKHGDVQHAPKNHKHRMVHGNTQAEKLRVRKGLEYILDARSAPVE
jgi:hypothetical protein